MTDEGDDGADARLGGADERRRLTSLAYRMLGTVAEAEDAVQETYFRWYRLSETARAEVRVPGAWLTTTASRVCLDMLMSARARRERYIGEWLPEPVPVDLFAGTAPARSESLTTSVVPSPEDRVTLDDAVSTALLVVLESMTPAERVAFVLHDVFAVPFAEIAETVGRSSDAVRQLASVARRRVRDRRVVPVDRASHDAAVRAFSDACRGGDLGVLLTVLDPSVELRSDGGGVVSAARRPVVGADNVARFLLGILVKRPDMRIAEHDLPGGLGYAMTIGDRIVGVANLRVVDGLIRDVWIQMNPAKLNLWEEQK